MSKKQHYGILFSWLSADIILVQILRVAAVKLANSSFWSSQYFRSDCSFLSRVRVLDGLLTHPDAFDILETEVLMVGFPVIFI